MLERNRRQFHQWLFPRPDYHWPSRPRLRVEVRALNAKQGINSVFIANGISSLPQIREFRILGLRHKSKSHSPRLASCIAIHVKLFWTSWLFASIFLNLSDLFPFCMAIFWIRCVWVRTTVWRISIFEFLGRVVSSEATMVHNFGSRYWGKSVRRVFTKLKSYRNKKWKLFLICLLYTSDAADE